MKPEEEVRMDIAQTENEIEELEEELDELEEELDDKKSYLEDLREILNEDDTNKKGVYKLNFDCGRQGVLEGIFISNRKEVNSIIGKTVHFGEVLGKHSEVSGTLEEENIHLVTQDLHAIQVIEDCGLITGFNPFDYLEEEDND